VRQWLLGYGAVGINQQVSQHSHGLQVPGPGPGQAASLTLSTAAAAALSPPALRPSHRVRVCHGRHHTSNGLEWWYDQLEGPYLSTVVVTVRVSVHDNEERHHDTV
jgi:hypothetical protein